MAPSSLARWRSTRTSSALLPPRPLRASSSRWPSSSAETDVKVPTVKLMRCDVGPWLPEPVDTSADPGLSAECGEVLERAVLVLLERLSPRERAAYVLREAFNYPYKEIEDVLRVEEANARQF